MGNPATIPFQVECLLGGGNRPVVVASMNGLPSRLVVHSNAGFYLQTDHRHAELAKISIQSHAGQFGIVSPGQLSTLGRDEGTLSQLTIEEKTWQDVPTSTFEAPDDGTTGMIGLQWIEANELVMDFPAQVIQLMAGQYESVPRGPSLSAGDHASVPMHRDSGTGRYLVDVTIGATTRSMIVSTVAGLVLDSDFAEAAGVDRGELSGQSGGPTGEVQQTYHFGQPMQISIGTWTSTPMQGDIDDIYGYMGQARPEKGATGGMLGADFLLAHRAVVDFGMRRIHLAREGS